MKINLAGASRAGRFLVMMVAVFGLVLGSVASAGVITSSEIHAVPSGTTGSGNGTLDLRLMTFSGSNIGNVSGAFNGDDANNALPQGGGDDLDSFAESYVTTAGELQAYYTLNFGATTTGQVEIALFIDLNETGGSFSEFNWMSKLDVIRNPGTIQGNPIASGDVTSAEQVAIQQIYTVGTVDANLDPGIVPVKLPVNAQGAGFADYSILTGIDPFALNIADVLLFNISMDTLSSGAEEVFLSGTYSGQDVQEAVDAVPEPSVFVLCGLGLVGLLLNRRRRVQ